MDFNDSKLRKEKRKVLGEKMSNDKRSERLQHARHSMSHRRYSMDYMKTQIRDKFFQRLRTCRSKSVDRLRHIVENFDNDTEYKSLSEIRQVLLAEKEAADLINFNEVSDLLKEVEEELHQISLEYEAEKYVNDNEREIEDTVDRLMGRCQVCLNLSVDAICPGCAAQITSELK